MFCDLFIFLILFLVALLDHICILYIHCRQNDPALIPNFGQLAEKIRNSLPKHKQKGVLDHLVILDWVLCGKINKHEKS